MRSSRLLIGLVGLGLITLLILLVPEASAETRLEGKVTDRSDDGNLLKGASIVLTSKDNDSRTYELSTDNLGYYSSDKLEPDVYGVRVSMDSYWDREATLQLTTDEQLIRDFSLLPQESGKGFLSGFVNSSHNGEAIDHAALTMELISGSPAANYRSIVEQDGYYARLVMPGEYELTVAAYGYEAYVKRIENVKELTSMSNDIFLDNVSSSTDTFIESQIKDGGEDPLWGVDISITKDDSRLGDRSTLSDANGWWQVGLENGGIYRVNYELEGYGPLEQSFTIEEGQTNPIDTAVLYVRPYASIDSIITGHDDLAVKGQDIVFQGSASGGSGSYGDFQWSYIGPQGGSAQSLGSGSTLTKSLPTDLDSGTYTIQLRVKDGNEQWSAAVVRSIELYGKPKVQIILDGTDNPSRDSSTVMTADLLFADFTVSDYQWQVFQGSVENEERLAHNKASFEIKWFDNNLDPGIYIVRLRATDQRGIISNWATLQLTLHTQNEGRPYIEGTRYDYYPDEWLEAIGNTQGAANDDVKWMIDYRDISHDQNLKIQLKDLDLDGGEHELICSYHNNEGWVDSDPQRFFYHADNDPEPHEVFLPLLFIFIILMLIRRRRKRKRLARKAAKAAAKAPAIPRPTAAPGLRVPESSLYDDGASPYAHPIRRIQSQPRSGTLEPIKSRTERPHLRSEGVIPAFGASMPELDSHGQPQAPEGKVELRSAVNYEKANIIFKVKVENNSDKPIAEVRVRPFAPSNLFKADKEERTIGLIQPKQAQTATFKLRPRGECGNVTLQAKVTYYDTGTNKYAELDAKPRETSIICPMLKYEDIDEQEWRKKVSKMLKVEETTDKIPMDGESLFSMVCDVFQDQNLASISMNVDRGRVFRGRALFWAKGAVAAKGLGYAAQIEIIGGELKSKLILKAYANGEDSLVGFYHCLLDEIEKRTSVRDYLDTGVTVQHVYGDMVKGGKVDVRDSVLQRSNITTEGGGGAGANGGSRVGDDDDFDPYLDVKGDRVEGGKVEIHDSVVTRSKVGPLGEERIPSGDGSTLDEEINRLRQVAKDDEEED